MIIFAGIVADVQRSIAFTLEQGRTGSLSAFFIVFLVVMVIAVVFFSVFIERAQRRIVVQYPKRQVGNRMFGGEASNLPLKSPPRQLKVKLSEDSASRCRSTPYAPRDAESICRHLLCPSGPLPGVR